MKKIPLLLGATMVATALNATVAQAAFINGSISFSDGFDTLPTTGASIVSDLTVFDIDEDNISIASPTDAFEDTTAATGFDFDITNLPTDFFHTTPTNFSFSLTNAVVDPSGTDALSCRDGLCADSIKLDVAGIVSALGFDDTQFLGIWTGNGSCLESTESNGECGSAITASWSVSLTATGGSPPAVPEPATTALFGFGLALAGIGRIRRKTR